MRALAMGMLFTFAFSSCADEDSETSVADTAKTDLGEKDEEEAGQTQVSCERLTPQACQERDDCAVVQGRPFNEKEGCYEDLADMACTGKGSGGGDIEVAVKDADGYCWLFSGGAKLPDSFSEATDDPECPSSGHPLCQTLSCWTETVEGCRTRDECDLLSASKVDKERKCRERFEPVGCRPRSFRDAGCGDDAMFCAKSKEGDIWIFGSSCIVPEWEYIETEEGVHCVEMQAYEPCEVDAGVDTFDGLNCADNHGRLDKDADLCWQYPKPAGELGWKEAINYCENLSLGGHTDWRLPQKEDFMDLLGDCHTATGIENSEFWLCSNCSNSAKCSSLFGSNSDWYWSIDQLSSNCDAGWTCGFGSGEIGKDCRSLSGVRCVRSEI